MKIHGRPAAILVIISLVILFAGCGNKDHRWSDAQQDKFKTQCLSYASGRIDSGMINSYCDCMQKKIAAKYPFYSDSLLLTEDQLKKPDWKEIAEDCRHNWSKDERKAFMETCVDNSKNDFGVDSATFYCRCMLKKIEIKYPRPDNAGNIPTSEYLEMAKECLK